MMEDPRTEEEKAQDLQRQIEQQTYPLPLPETKPAQELDHPLDKT
jgi:hypothetical protein